MSNDARRWAEAQTAGSRAAKALLLALADAANTQGACWPSQHDLAARLECSIDTIQRSMKALEGRGLISRSHRHGPRGYRISDLLTLNRPAELHDIPVDPKPQPAAKDGAGLSRIQRPPKPQPAGDHFVKPSLNHQRICATQVANAELPGLESVPASPTAAPICKTKASAIAKPIEDPAFDAFWTTYPKRVDRKLAAKAFGKLSADDKQAAIAGATRYAAEVRANGTAANYVKGPASWINAERYRDETATVPSRPQTSVDDRRTIDRERVRLFLDTDHWGNRAGPRPGDKGCRIDLDILAEFGFGPRSMAAPARQPEPTANNIIRLPLPESINAKPSKLPAQSRSEVGTEIDGQNRQTAL